MRSIRVVAPTSFGADLPRVVSHVATLRLGIALLTRSDRLACVAGTYKSAESSLPAVL